MENTELEREVQEIIGKKFDAKCEKFANVIANISEDLSRVYHIDGFFELDVDTVYEILSNGELYEVSEVEVFRVAIKWITHIKEERVEYIPKIMGCVKFQQMSHQELMECLEITNSVRRSSLKDVFRRVNWYVTDVIVEASREALNVPSIGAKTRLADEPKKPAWPYFFTMHAEPFGTRNVTEDQNYRKEVDATFTVKDDKKPETSFVSRLRDLLCCFGGKGDNKKTFGMSIEDLMRRAPKGAVVPTIVSHVCEYVSDRGFEAEGIFRLNGSLKVLKRLKEKFDKQGDVKLKNEKDVMAVAGLLKHFLRELKNPVIPEPMTDQFVRIQKDHKESTGRYIFLLRQAVEKLPQLHYQLLKYIIGFLVPVAEKEVVNKMGHKQLGIVFGPNLFRCGEGLDALNNLTHVNDVVCGLIKYYSAIFRDENECPWSRPSKQDGLPPKKDKETTQEKDGTAHSAWANVIQELKKKRSKVQPLET